MAAQVIVIALVGCIVGTLLGLIEIMWFSTRFFFGPNDSPIVFLELRDGLIIVSLIAYGMFRVIAFHPMFLREYSTWLERTPWKPGLPLPLGPVHLNWPDLLVAGGMALLLEDPREIFGPGEVRTSGLTGLLLFVLSHLNGRQMDDGDESLACLLWKRKATYRSDD